MLVFLLFLLKIRTRRKWSQVLSFQGEGKGNVRFCTRSAEHLPPASPSCPRWRLPGGPGSEDGQSVSGDVPRGVHRVPPQMCDAQCRVG